MGKIEGLVVEDDLLVVSKFKNNLLAELMEGKTAVACAEAIGVHQTTFGELLNLRIYPMKWNRKEGKLKWRVTVEKIAKYFKRLPEDLFPLSLYDLPLPRSVSRTYDSVKLVPLLEASRECYLPDMDQKLDEKSMRVLLDCALQKLSPQQEKVIRKNFGLDGNEQTCKEIGEDFCVPDHRIVRIRNKALRKLRRPVVSKALREYVRGYVWE